LADIKIVRLTDYSIALGTMRACWDSMAEDGAEITFVPDLIGENWMSVIVDNKYAGFFRFVNITSVMQECHVCILEPYRRYIRHAGIECYKILLEGGIQKLSANIPSFNKKAISYAKKMGFTKQGENSKSYMKNKKLYSLVQMGIERKEMEELCHQPYQH